MCAAFDQKQMLAPDTLSPDRIFVPLIGSRFLFIQDSVLVDVKRQHSLLDQASVPPWQLSNKEQSLKGTEGNAIKYWLPLFTCLSTYSLLWIGRHYRSEI